MLDLEAASQAIASSSEFSADAVRRFAAREPARLQWPALTTPTPDT